MNKLLIFPFVLFFLFSCESEKKINAQDFYSLSETKNLTHYEWYDDVIDYNRKEIVLTSVSIVEYILFTDTKEYKVLIEKPNAALKMRGNPTYTITCGGDGCCYPYWQQASSGHVIYSCKCGGNGECTVDKVVIN